MDIKKLIAKAVVAGDEVNVKDYLQRFDVNTALEDGKSALVIAAEHGNDNMVRLLVCHCKANISKDGGRALHKAAVNGHSGTVTILVQLGVDVNAKISYGRTALHLAALDGHSDTVKTLVQLDADVNTKWFGETALYLAAKNGHSDTVKTLAQLGADVNAKWYGRTALHMAALKGHSDTVKTLVALRADVNAKDWDGQTALYFASHHNHSDTVKTLVMLGADVNAIYGLAWIRLLIRSNKDVMLILRNPNLFKQERDEALRQKDEVVAKLDEVVKANEKLTAENESLKHVNQALTHEKDEALRQKNETVFTCDEVVKANEKLTAENESLRHDNQALTHVNDCLWPVVTQHYIRLDTSTVDAETNTLNHGSCTTEATVSRGMQYEDQERLRLNFKALVDNLDAKVTVDELYQNHVISAEDRALVCAQLTPHERSRVLLAMLPSKGDAAYSCFRSALLQHHKWLIGLLDNTMFEPEDAKHHTVR